LHRPLTIVATVENSRSRGANFGGALNICDSSILHGMTAAEFRAI
jgi:hypothetical protein